MSIVLGWSIIAKCYIFGKFLLPVLITSFILSLVIFVFIPKSKSEWHQLFPLAIFCFILTALQFLPEFALIALIWGVLVLCFDFNEEDDD